MSARRSALCLAIIGLATVPFTAACAEDAAAGSGRTQVPASTVRPVSTAPAPTRLDIVATEYRWSGLPAELPAGSYPMTFRNEGTEAHEISIFRDPQHRGLRALAELGPAGLEDEVEEVALLLAGPGTSADQELVVELTPGAYEVVCFIPGPDGRGHFDHGMHRTLVVR